MSGGLRKRPQKPYEVRVPSTTVRDTSVSYRALGVLTWIMDQAEGWDIRSDQMANDRKRADGTGPDGRAHRREGRGAIRTALHELGAAGYYRLERRRLRDGRTVMGTAASLTPVDSWAEQYALFDGKAVPVSEQPDGSFYVRYPNGALQPDDWPVPEIIPPPGPPEDDDEPDGDGPSTLSDVDQTGDRFSVPGEVDQTGDRFLVPGPGTEKPAPGKPAPGIGSPLVVPSSLFHEVDPPTPADAGGPTPTAEPQTPGPCGRIHGGNVSCRPCGTNPRAAAKAHRRAALTAAAAQRRPCRAGHLGQIEGSCSACASEANGLADLPPPARLTAVPGQIRPAPICARCITDPAGASTCPRCTGPDQQRAHAS